MQFKKYLLSSLLLCFGVAHASDFKGFFSSGNEQLDQLEQAEYKKYLQKSQEFHAGLPEAQQFLQRMMGKFMVIMLTVSGQMSFDEVQTKEDVCKFVRLICQSIRNDDHFTNFVKGLADYFEDNMCRFIVNYYDQIKNLQMQNEFSIQQILEMFSEYLPKNINLFRVYVDWSVWGREYMLQQLEVQGSLTVDDIAYTGYKMIELCKLPEEIASICKDFIQAISKSIASLPEEVLEEMWKQTTSQIYNSDIETLLQMMQATIEERETLIALGFENVSSEKLYTYIQLVKTMLDMKLFVEQLNAAEAYLLTDKIFFKN